MIIIKLYNGQILRKTLESACRFLYEVDLYSQADQVSEILIEHYDSDMTYYNNCCTQLSEFWNVPLTSSKGGFIK